MGPQLGHRGAGARAQNPARRHAGLVWWGVPGTSGQRHPEACAMKSSGPDTAVCLEKQVAGPMASGRGEGGPGRKAGLLPSSCWWGCGSHGVRPQLPAAPPPPPALRRSWKFRFPGNCLLMLTHWQGAGSVQMICKQQIPRIWHGRGLARARAAGVLAASCDLSLPRCAQLINEATEMQRLAVTFHRGQSRASQALLSPPTPAPLPRLAASPKTW